MVIEAEKKNSTGQILSTHIRNAGTGEPKQAIGVVALHDSQSSGGSGHRETSSTVSCHQLQVEHLLSLLLVVIPGLHHERLLPLVLPVAQVTRDVAQVRLSGLRVELVDVAAAQLGPVQADVLEEAREPLLALGVGANENRRRSWNRVTYKRTVWTKRAE